MIRKMQNSDIETISQIWLDGNLTAHNFINPNYWIDHLPAVKQQFQNAQIYVFYDGSIEGFVGLENNYIAGIFVEKTARDQGIGKKLLDYLKDRYTELSLDVYEKNSRALTFYLKNDFVDQSTDIDVETDEKEHHLVWKK